MSEGPVALFTVWPRIAAALRARSCVLFLDFDGTLLPFTTHPDAAHLSPEQRALLRRLACAPGWTVAVVSGRALRDVRRRIRVPGLIYAGNHGLEIEGRGLRFRHPGALAARKELGGLRRATNHAMREFRGVRIEDKGLSWTLHFRSAPPAARRRVLRTFWDTVRAAVRSGRVCIRQGVMSREVLPPVAWDKGAAVRWILRWLRGRSRPVVIYLGDDAADEPAFAALVKTGISVIVGRRQRTRARFFLRHPGEVQRLLRLLTELLDETVPCSSAGRPTRTTQSASSRVSPKRVPRDAEEQAGAGTARH
ncbi:MAG: trehalose-phosphatase [Candidatus Methylomirabilales bacterium]